MNEEQLEAFEERAAIIEYDGGRSREDAEAIATSLVLTKKKQARQTQQPKQTENSKTNPELEKVKRILNGQ